MTFTLADPAAPFAVQPSHLNKDMLPKSTSSCRLSLVTRQHRTAKCQEFICDSYEESVVGLNILALPHIVAIKEQAVTIPYIKPNGSPTTQRMDLLCWRRDGAKFVVSVKYAKKARRADYLEEIEALNRQLSASVANRAVVLSRESFHPYHNQNAELIHHVRMGWDPESDQATLEAAQAIGKRFRIADLFSRTGVDDGRTFRSAIRLIGDGDLRLQKLLPITEDVECLVA
jgi:hypothetical protein